MVIAGIDPNQQKAGEITRWAKGYWEVVHPYSANGRYEIHPPRRRLPTIATSSARRTERRAQPA